MPSAPSRSALLGLFAAASFALAVFPVANHLRGGVNKDYPLWYATGVMVRAGMDVYPADPRATFPFMYPPFAAVALAGLSYLGQTGMVVALVAGTALSWLACILLSVRLAGGPRPTPVAVWLLPSAACLPFVYDAFLLGQPNLFLLALVLGGLACLRAGRGSACGALFAVAAAVKAFPAVLIAYLLWRRHWRAAAAMAGTLAALLFAVPAVVLGPDRAARDLRVWADGMLMRNGPGGVGQRPGQSLGWRNQSLLGVGSRYLRPINAELEAVEPGTRPVYVNLAQLDYGTATAALAALALLVGVGYAAVLPRRADRTPKSDAAEYGMLVILTVVGSPYAFPYFFVWLLFPVTVLVSRAASDPDRAARRASWVILAAAGALIAAGAPAWGSRVGMAAGGYFWGSVVLLVGLGWHLRRSAVRRSRAEPPAPAATERRELVHAA